MGKTQGGLAVFRHFMKGDWKVGKNFLNPFYDDKKASCNVYFDKGSKQYKIKDFGDVRFNGDCFTLVALLHQLDVRTEFGEALHVIASEMGLNSGQRVEVPPKVALVAQFQKEELSATEYEVKPKSYSETEQRFWQSYGVKWRESGSSSHLVKVEVWVVILKNGLCLPFAFRARLRTT